MTTTEKAKRTVAKKQYVVQLALVGARDWQDIEGQPDHEDTQAAKAWLRDNAEAGKQYRIVAVCWSGGVEVEQKTVTRLK